MKMASPLWLARRRERWVGDATLLLSGSPAACRVAPIAVTLGLQMWSTWSLRWRGAATWLRTGFYEMLSCSFVILH